MKSRSSLLRLLAASGGIVGLAAVASAQPTVIHVDGATLLENFMRARAITNDYIDADGNGTFLANPAGPGLQQLAPFEIPSVSGSGAAWSPATYWGVLYSASGSGNGYQGLINIGRTFSTTDGLAVNSCVTSYTYDPDGAGPLGIGSAVGSQLATDLTITSRTRAYFNRQRFISGGGVEGSTTDPLVTGSLLNIANPGGFPVRQDFTGFNANAALSTASYKAVFTSGGNNLTSRAGFGAGCAPTAATTRLGFRGEADPVGRPSTGGVDGLSNSVVGGMTVDVAILDVPPAYFSTIAGTPVVGATPLSTGYGNNAALARTLTGALTPTPNAAFNNNGGNKLASLGTAVLAGTPSGTYPSGYEGTNNGNVIFATPILFAPVSPVVSFGTFNRPDTTTVRISQLQHLYGTGRLPTGENLMVITRDSGSGTRNAFQNSIGQDPSWGVGDNVGVRNNTDPESQAGAAFVPSNKGSNDRVELALVNNRLAIGYVGPERGVTGSGTASWLSQGRLAIPSVIADIAPYNATQPSRPTTFNLLNNNLATNPQAWVIGGPAALATFGDPTSAPANKGGLGWQGAETRPASLNPAMRNVEAAAFVNNITRSIRDFIAQPGADDTVFSPGEWAAGQFILVAAQDRVQQLTSPTTLIANPTYAATLRNWYENVATPAQSVYKNALFAAFDSGVSPNSGVNGRAGKVPTRAAATSYSDNAYNAGGTLYVRGVNGATLSYGANLPLRNLVTGDFSGDGRRDVNDAGELVRAEVARRNNDTSYLAPAIPGGSLLTGLATGTDPLSAGDLSFEILGDFNGDGSFNRADVRYFADGLGINATTGRLDRKAAFIAVDNAAVAAGQTLPYFPTTLASTKPYAAGDARGDIAGSGRNTGGNAVGLQRFQTTPGYAPTADGAVNTHDVYYVIANLVAANNGAPLTSLTTGGPTATWATLGEAVKVDFSADINGDGAITIADLNEICTVVLGVPVGDLNFDGVVDAADRQIVQNGIASAPAVITYNTGDLNGDGAVTSADLALIPAAPTCRADYDQNGSRTIDDIFIFLNDWFAGCSGQQGAPCFGRSADIDNNGSRTIDDIFIFLNFWFAGCP